MPESIQSPPSLLTLTAPKAQRAEASDDAGFDAELATAVEDAKPKQAAPKEAAPESDEAATASDGAAPDAPAAEGDGEQAESGAVEEAGADDPAEIDGADAELLATFAVTETIVLETSSGTALPEEATTSIDIESIVTGIEASTQDEASGSEAVPLEVEAAGTTAAEGDAQTSDEPTAEPVLAVAAEENGADAETESAEIKTTPAVTSTASAEGDSSTSDEAGQEEASSLTAQPAGASESEETMTDDSAEHRSSAKAEPSKQMDQTSDETTAPNTTTSPSATHAAVTQPSKDATEVDDSSAADAADRVDSPRESINPRGDSRVEAGDKSAPAERPTVDPARFVSRVSRAIDFAQQRGGGPVEMRLSPPELGSLQVRIQVKDGVMTAKLEVETPVARNALLDNLPALRDRLEQQQIRIDKFDVEVRDDQQRGGDWRQQQDNQQRADQRQSQGEPRPTRRPAAAASDPAEPTPARTISFTSSGINLVA